jgi:GNAT superfamily N-acetyltransferase
MHIRPATPEDAPSLVEMAVSFRNHLERDLPTDSQFAASIERLLVSEDAQFFLAIQEETPVGYVLQRYRFSMWACGLEATLEDLFVDPSARGGGVGRALVAFALQAARDRGCTTACLDTNEFNAASTAIYTQLGFSAISQRWKGRQVFFRKSLACPGAGA